MVSGGETETTTRVKKKMLDIFHEAARGWHPTHTAFLVALETRVYQGIQANEVTLKDYVKFKLEDTLRLEEMAARDYLTDLWARAGLKERYDEICRQSESVSGLAIDIDNFDTINNTLGHDEGDKVLIAFAGLLKEQTARKGTAGRIGGDEFVLVFPDTSEEEALIIAQTIVTEFSQRIETRVRDLGVSVSVGVYASREPIKERNLILKRADEAQIAAKKAGKDRVLTWQPGHQV